MQQATASSLSESLLPSRRSVRQTLLIDADDTLWENNIYFERAIAAFVSFLNHRVHTQEEVREHLNACERATIVTHGYGLQSFRRSLIDCFEKLSDGPVTPEKHERIVSFTEAIASHEIELLADVEETLRELSGRHRLVLVTKGNFSEQQGKVERSGLRDLFAAVEVPHEKTAAMYSELSTRYECDPANTWMIGNSPRSDINPALAAGLNAVFIPHDHTWVLEHEVIEAPPGPGRLLELDRFASLLEYF
ncbi:MAG TPA: HAD family hydrolase [Acidobacteriaceae bacterium]|jgi:putative hydrolase of the HAD superfamily